MVNLLKIKQSRLFWPFVCFAIVLAVLPAVIKGNYIISVLIYCMVFASLGSAWNLIGGYGGQISWCHSGFVAIGAYCGYMFLKYWNLSPWLTLPVGMLLSYGLATLIGFGTFRLKGSYFSLATMAFAEILRILLLYFKNQTGGAAGLSIPYKGVNFLNLSFSTDIAFYYILLILMVAVVAGVTFFEQTKTGHFLKVIREDETAAQSLGIRTFKVKLRTFQLSAVVTCVIGMLYGFFLGFIDPASVAGNDLAVRIGLVAIIGGLGTIGGPIVGAFIIIPLIEIAGVAFGSRGGSQILYGLGIILIVMFMPNGLMQVIKKNIQKKTVAAKEEK